MTSLLASYKSDRTIYVTHNTVLYFKLSKTS
jgi:hypothetical protein